MRKDRCLVRRFMNKRKELTNLHPHPSRAPPAYKLAEGVPVPLNIEPHQVMVADMARITRAIVEIEGPIHQDEIARRVTALFGKSRTGSQISAAALRGLKALKTTSILTETRWFLDDARAVGRSPSPRSQ